MYYSRVRDQGSGIRDVLEGGGGGGLAGTPPPPLGSSCGPRQRRTKNSLSLNPLGAKGAETKFRLSASNIGRGGGGVWGGGGPFTVYGHSNTSLLFPPRPWRDRPVPWLALANRGQPGLPPPYQHSFYSKITRYPEQENNKACFSIKPAARLGISTRRWARDLH